MKFTALAACAALVFGLGWKGLGIGKPPVGPSVPPAGPDGEHTPAPVQGDVFVGIDIDRECFVAQGPEEGSKLMFPAVLTVDYTDATGAPQTSASLAYNPGTFSNPLDKEDIQKIFWGKDGKPEVTNPKTDTGDFPLFLMGWQGYLITGDATYKGDGSLWMLSIHGEKGEDEFTLELCPGMLPPECCVISGLTTTTVLGTQVTGWYCSYDRDGDGEAEAVVTSSFMAGGYGVTFENVGSGGSRSSEGDGGEATDLGGAKLFNAMLVNHFCRADGAPYLDHLLRCEAIPAWTEAGYDTIADALAGAEIFAQAHPEADFLSYLPTQGPEGYGEFYGHLSYQEGRSKELWVRWTRGYDDVEVDVHLPEGGNTGYYHSQLVDVNVPESYDWRLYDGPICDSVPEEYRMAFYKPAFRAEDMSLEVVKARMTDKDTGGRSCRFYVIHENGVVVSYDCAGVSAGYVWSLVEATLR